MAHARHYAERRLLWRDRVDRYRVSVLLPEEGGRRRRLNPKLALRLTPSNTDVMLPATICDTARFFAVASSPCTRICSQPI